MGNAREASARIFSHFHVDLEMKQDDPTVAQKRIWEHVKGQFPHPLQEKPNPELLLKELERFRILSCIRQGSLGVDALNEMIFQSLWSEAKRGQWLCLPILITRNDYALNLFNGDAGILIKQKMGVEDCAYFWDSQGEVRCLSALSLPPYEYAYCISVHKSQGSEYEKILLLIPQGSEVFGKEVLYTACTRSKSQLEIDGREDTILKAIEKTSRKCSGIKERLIDEKA